MSLPSTGPSHAWAIGGVPTEELPWRQVGDVLLCTSEGEHALLVRESWSVIRLDEVSRTIWALLIKPATTTELVSELLRQYDVSRDRCRSEILPILIELRDAGAVTGGDRSIA